MSFNKIYIPPDSFKILVFIFFFLSSKLCSNVLFAQNEPREFLNSKNKFSKQKEFRHNNKKRNSKKNRANSLSKKTDDDSLNSDDKPLISIDTVELSPPKGELQKPNPIFNIKNSSWTFEGVVQVHSVSGESSPWVGFGTTYKIFHFFHLGFRGFLPTSQPTDKSTYGVQAISRIFLNSDNKIQFFLEPNYAYNFFNFSPFTSYGLAAGAVAHLQPGLSVGVFGGFEAGNIIIDSIGFEETNGLILYPKAAFFVNFYL